MSAVRLPAPVVVQCIFVIPLDTAWGPGVVVGQRLDRSVNIADTAAVILTAAGAPLPDNWDAVVPEGIFTSV